MKQNFVDPEKLLMKAGLSTGMKVADLGCGGGFFTLPAARMSECRACKEIAASSPKYSKAVEV